jgi:hypothetical protein
MGWGDRHPNPSPAGERRWYSNEGAQLKVRSMTGLQREQVYKSSNVPPDT